MTGYGIFFKNSFGQLIMGKSSILHSFGSVLEAKVVAVFKPIHTAIAAGFQAIMFEPTTRSSPTPSTLHMFITRSLVTSYTL